MPIPNAPLQANVNPNTLNLGKDVGRRLRYLRAQPGITQQELAPCSLAMLDAPSPP